MKRPSWPSWVQPVALMIAALLYIVFVVEPIKHAFPLVSP